MNVNEIYAPDDVRAQLARWLSDARAHGFSRRQLSEVTGLTTTALWRIERGNAHLDEVKTVTACAEKVARARLKPARTVRVTCDEARRRLAAIESLLDEAVGLRATELRAAVQEALAIIQGVVR